MPQKNKQQQTSMYCLMKKICNTKKAMKIFVSRYGFWSAMICAAAFGMVVLLLVLLQNGLSQIENASRDRAVTSTRTLSLAISGLVKDAPDHEGRVLSIIEESSRDSDVMAVGILFSNGSIALQKGRLSLPTLPPLDRAQYQAFFEDYLLTIEAFDIKSGCASHEGACGCKNSKCSCVDHSEWALAPGRYGLAMLVDPKGNVEVRRAIIGVSMLGFAVLAALLLTVGLLVRSIRTKEILSKEIAVEQQRRENLKALSFSAAGLAHEIRNPLGAVAGYAQLLLEKTDDEEKKRSLNLILKELERIGERLEEFLSFAGKKANKKEKVDLRQIVSESTTLFRADAAALNIKIYESVPTVPIVIDGDASSLKELITNLILNALQACTGGEYIKVSLASNNEGIYLRVEDNGVGIKNEDLPRLFEPYFTTKPKGTGLGLAISRRIAEDHGAVLSLKPAEDKGTVAELVFHTGPAHRAG